MGIFYYRLVSITTILVLFLMNSCISNPVEQLALLEEAHNSHDIERCLNIYTNDAKFVLVDGWIAMGKNKLKERFEWDFAMHGSLQFTDCKVIKDTVLCKVEEHNDFFNLLGIDAVNYEYSKFIFEHGLIKEVQAKVSPQSIETIDNALSEFMLWASSERIVELDELVADGDLVFTADKAEKWMILLQTYATEKMLEETNPSGNK